VLDTAAFTVVVIPITDLFLCIMSTRIDSLNIEAVGHNLRILHHHCTCSNICLPFKSIHNICILLCSVCMWDFIFIAAVIQQLLPSQGKNKHISFALVMIFYVLKPFRISLPHSISGHSMADGVSSTSEFHMVAMMLGNWKVWRWGSFQWHIFHTKFYWNPLFSSKIVREQIDGWTQMYKCDDIICQLFHRKESRLE
jgi:hypothetical protein